MKNRDDIRCIVAAALILYAAFTALNAQAKVRRAQAFRDELALQASALQSEVDALRLEAAACPSDELMEKLARERLGLVRQGEIIFYFTTQDRED